MKALTYVLALLAALRATRFITSDHLGEWWLVGPAKRWAWRRGTHGYSPTEINADPAPTPDPASGWRAKLVSGLDCPFCVGFWITGAAVLAAAAANRGPRRRAAFQLLAGAVGANYVTGHISSRLDG
ncbi:hypothetical protein SEA_KOZIE_10 [Microbacterium phage Kozie]|uniref:DUF1360 domain-containing protein n=1 Tax=Microbacterium phage Kozie TaxID=2885981 RepID=A0AAE8Y922_9CAUD|nr:hypothetical protein QC998_gp10 [Microbacterium phage Kozie]UDL16206.1 hypothetical protein SEA_KOZIE_10 [Microbacterium phage Kozie]